MIAAIAAQPEPVLQPGAEAVGGTALPPGQPFAYHGRTLRSPTDTVDVNDPGGSYAYARLKPQGVNKRFDYFVELGRPWTGQTMPGGRKSLGFWSFSEQAEVRQLPNGYQLWCEPVPKEPTSASCAVLLKTLPLAAINFGIGRRPTSDAAMDAIATSEALLKKGIIWKPSPAPPSAHR